LFGSGDTVRQGPLELVAESVPGPG